MWSCRCCRCVSFLPLLLGLQRLSTALALHLPAHSTDNWLFFLSCLAASALQPRIKAPQAWTHSRDATKVFTCVVDTGVKVGRPAWLAEPGLASRPHFRRLT